MRRSVPFLFLALVTGAALARAWPRIDEARRFRTILDLVQKHRETDASGWTPSDAERLWSSIFAFVDREPIQLSLRLMDAVEAADPRVREAAMTLIAELAFYDSAGNQVSARWYEAGQLPYPTRAPWSANLDRLAMRTWIGLRAARIAAVREDASLTTRRSLVFVADPDAAPCLREALDQMARRDPDETLRVYAVWKLDLETQEPSVSSLFQALALDSSPRVRWAARAALARRSDPGASRSLVEGLTVPPRGVPVLEILRVCDRMRVFPSLEDLIWPTYAYLVDQQESFTGLPCDLRQPWEAWLALRESEGFAPGPQAARDDAYRED